MSVCVSVRVSVRACVCERVSECVSVCACVREGNSTYSLYSIKTITPMESPRKA